MLPTQSCLTKEVKGMREQVLAHNGLSFLRKLNDTWRQHYKAVEMTRDILMYMDKQYVTQSRKRTVEQLGKYLWLDLLLNEQRVRHMGEEAFGWGDVMSLTCSLPLWDTGTDAGGADKRSWQAAALGSARYAQSKQRLGRVSVVFRCCMFV